MVLRERPSTTSELPVTLDSLVLLVLLEPRELKDDLVLLVPPERRELTASAILEPLEPLEPRESLV